MSKKTPTAPIELPTADEPRKRSTYVDPGHPQFTETTTEADRAEPRKRIPEFLEDGGGQLAAAIDETRTLAERKLAEEQEQGQVQRDADVTTMASRPVPARDTVISKAQGLISGDRDEEYGDAQMSFQKIADIWSVILNVRVTEKQVAMMMAGLKLARLSYDPDSEDGWVDLIGYAALGAEVRETDLSRDVRSAL